MFRFHKFEIDWGLRTLLVHCRRTLRKKGEENKGKDNTEAIDHKKHAQVEQTDSGKKTDNTNQTESGRSLVNGT